MACFRGIHLHAMLCSCIFAHAERHGEASGSDTVRSIRLSVWGALVFWVALARGWPGRVAAGNAVLGATAAQSIKMLVMRSNDVRKQLYAWDNTKLPGTAVERSYEII